MLIKAVFKRENVSVTFVFRSVNSLYKRFQKFKLIRRALNKKQNRFSICFQYFK